RLGLRRAVSIMHPVDHRPVFAVPWEGVTLFGTTDVDHGPGLEMDPRISSPEVDYLLAGMRHAFPLLELDSGDVLATLAGVRAVLDTGKSDPSKESREHILWNENGLLTVTGGKLTTFRLMAHQALQAVQARLPQPVQPDREQRVLDIPPEAGMPPDLNPALRLRLLGRYGMDAGELVTRAGPGEFDSIGDSPSTWAELRWAARAEGVVHLEDLLLRRVRLGLTLPEGGMDFIERVRAVAQPELGWDDERWVR